MCIRDRYKAYLDYFISRKIISMDETLISSGLYKSLIFELIMVLPHPNILFYQVDQVMFSDMLGKEFTRQYNDWWNLFNLGKLVLIIKYIFVSSKYYSARAHRICTMYGFQPSYIFVVQSMMRNDSFGFTVGFFITSLLSFSHAIRLSERPLVQIATDFTYDTWNQSIWNVLVTMTTVGYGDVYPRTTTGRWIAFIMCFFGIFSTSLFVIACNSVVETSSLEIKALSTVKRLQSRSQVRWMAATMLARLAKASRKKEIPVHDVLSIRGIINDFKAQRRDYESLLDDTSTIHEEFHRMIVGCLEEVRSFTKSHSRLSDIFDEVRLRFHIMQELKPID
eukprot:TRINITY_DN3112_c0_g1_i4.p1 TRINITY_DN3112_c0_g1~~TRINITY_DN3112_c0_g1_i4.p1  ORF type:complete len:352 (-),score=52.12 TRINITY_DN3112_c0_g1_i4:101-1108(-)